MANRIVYARAIAWIANNDDEDLGPRDAPLVSICLVADIFNRSIAEV